MEAQARHEKELWHRHCDDEEESARVLSETLGFASLIVCLGLQQQPLRTFLFLYPFFHPTA